MTIEAVMSQISADWVLLTPPDRPTLTYHALDDSLEPLGGTSAERGFRFIDPDRLRVISELGNGVRQVLYALEARLNIAKVGRTDREMAVAVANESALLNGAVEGRTLWPAGVVSVETFDAVTTIEEDSEDRIVSLAYEAVVQEGP